MRSTLSAARAAWLLGVLALIGLGLQGVQAGPLPQTPVLTPTPEATDCRPEARLDAPLPDLVLRGIVTVGGWAVDPASPAGTGVAEVEVYLDGYGNDPGQTYIGRAEYGGVRTDVAERFNDARFARSAFSLSWDASTAGAGEHTLVVLYRTRCGWSSLTQTVQVDGPTILLQIDRPAQGVPVSAPVRIEGWAADPAAPVGTGVERVDMYLDGQITTRGIPLGEVSYGESRPDVGAALGGQEQAARFSRSGWSVLWNPTGLTPGRHLLTFYARGPAGAVARSLALEVTPEGAGPRGATPALPLPEPTLPGAPTPAVRPAGASFPLTAAGTTPNSVALAWNAVPNAASYDVLVAEGAGVFSPLQNGLADTRLVATNLVPGQTYRFVVRAYDANGAEVARSTTLTVATPLPGPTATLPLGTLVVPTATPLGRG
ncbi:MAG TPA: hypothetical protein VKZ60_20160 [Chloroflexota bacterium]|nr:hypothetical protein [Chloroflexota bacterium]